MEEIGRENYSIIKHPHIHTHIQRHNCSFIKSKEKHYFKNDKHKNCGVRTVYDDDDDVSSESLCTSPSWWQI